MMPAIRSAWSRVTGRLFVGQWLGNLVLMLLAACWLQIPDSHAWQFAVSMISSVLLVIAFLWLYAASFRHLRTCRRPKWWQSCLLLAVFVVVWWLLLQPTAAGRAREAIFAGYWNSQSPPWLRHLFGYSSLIAWQERFYDCVQWLLAGLLLPPAIELCACGLHRDWLGCAAAVYRRWFYWLCVLVFGFGGTALTGALADWAPAAGLLGQSLSVAARLGAAYTVDILLWCFLLGLIGCYLDSHASVQSKQEQPQ
ncbi:MAG TPA: hypothetical protein VMB49_08360 [Acidobacteriaceae bacterium]|nr:hypothetical protein [Acidobacteriaceae bacterium]